METKDFFTRLLELTPPWTVELVDYDLSKREVHLYVAYGSREWVEKKTGEIFPVFDLREERTWRHLDVMEYRTFVHCRMPRIKRSDGEIVSCPVPWADEGERHTRGFHNHVVRILLATRNQTRTGELLRISYEKTHRIMQRAVAWGLARRDLSREEIPFLHIDEKAYQKGHCYLSVLSDSVGKRVLNVAPGRTSDACKSLLAKALPKERLRRVHAVCIDLWDAYALAVKKSARRPILSMINFIW